MNHSATLQQLTERLDQIEAEIVSIREELRGGSQEDPTSFKDAKDSFPWVDKAALREQMKRLFRQLSIQGEPIGAKALQKTMSDSGLRRNEMSESIIAAREE